ncbi:translationally-controlled tumor protein homolog [Hypanus sabinus]|uniref:translationally-controlled tumor protein homolog n=1 Tax=Hypanus sabinus TaxID=79690 RepID=UPI0028C3AB9B|nr:translationally-controlled tumor protein homolog [Hypanus sabinus]
MRLFRCIVSGDEMFSDIYKIKEGPKGLTYEVEGKYVCRTEGGIDDSLIGGNASQESPPELSDTLTVSGVDIILNHHLKETYFAKNDYKIYIKEYMKRLREKIQKENPEALENFTLSAKAVVGDILSNFSDYKFYVGENMDTEGMVALLNYRPDGTPYMVFFKDGLEIEKC